MASVGKRVLAVAVLLSAGRAGSAEPAVAPALLKARVEAARQTYDYVLRNFRESRPPISELVYRWSCRWLDAERELSDRPADRVAAYEAHLARMRELESVVRDRWKNRYVSADEATAAQFYRIEAEIWLARAQKP